VLSALRGKVSGGRPGETTQAGEDQELIGGWTLLLSKVISQRYRDRRLPAPGSGPPYISKPSCKRVRSTIGGQAPSLPNQIQDISTNNCVF